MGSALTLSRDDLLRTVTLNTWPALSLIQEAMARGLADEGGAIVNISSGSPKKTTPSMASYAAAKAALNALTRTLAHDLGRRGVRVNAVSPGLTKTHATKDIWGADDGRAAGHNLLLGHLTEAEDIAAAVAFLLSDEARSITGVLLDVDAGNHVDIGSWSPFSPDAVGRPGGAPAPGDTRARELVDPSPSSSTGRMAARVRRWPCRPGRRVYDRGVNSRHPFAPGSISLRLYPHNELDAGGIVRELCDQARLALALGFDGIMTTNTTMRFAGYLPNPLQVSGFILEGDRLGVGGSLPLVLPLRPVGQLAEEVAWLAARHPGRVGIGVAAGALPLDFEAMGVPFAEAVPLFKERLPRIVQMLQGRDLGQLEHDPALEQCTETPIPVLEAASSRTAARRAAACGAGILTEGMSAVRN